MHEWLMARSTQPNVPHVPYLALNPLSSLWPGDIAGYLTKTKASLSSMRLPPQGLAELVTLIGSGKITGKIGKEILPELVDSWEGSVIGLVRERGMEAITDPAVIRQLVETVVAANADKVADYRQVLSV